ERAALDSGGRTGEGTGVCCELNGGRNMSEGISSAQKDELKIEAGGTAARAGNLLFLGDSFTKHLTAERESRGFAFINNQKKKKNTRDGEGTRLHEVGWMVYDRSTS